MLSFLFFMMSQETDKPQQEFLIMDSDPWIRWKVY